VVLYGAIVYNPFIYPFCDKEWLIFKNYLAIGLGSLGKSSDTLKRVLLQNAKYTGPIWD